MTYTDREPGRFGTPLAAWFLLICGVAVVLAGLRPVFSRESEVFDSESSWGLVAFGLVVGSTTGFFMGLLSRKPVIASFAGIFAGAILGMFAWLNLAASADFRITVVGASALLGLALATRLMSRGAAIAWLLAPGLVWGFNASDTAAADPPAASRPKVLILGDSISMGYTGPVKTNLADVADVSRPRDNCQHTAFGLKKIDEWLGKEKWDVIHFNWGIWDTHMLDENGALVRDEGSAKGTLHLRHTPEQYRENLTSLVKTLKGTGAKLIWASTTPIMRYKGKRYEDLTSLNKVAAEIMKQNDIAIDDLYEFTLPNVAKWQSGDKVHFNALGNEELGKKVSEEIRKALPAAKKS